MATQLQRHEDWINPDLDLVGVDGNGFAVIGAVSKALRRAGNPPAVIEAFRAEATAGDYDNLLRAAMSYAGMLEASDG